MATDVMWQRTQLGFAFPQQQQIPAIPGHGLASHIPQRTADIMQTGSAPHLSSQLQFIMGVPTSPNAMATRFRKPKPIIIEKLEGQNIQDRRNQTVVSRSNEGMPQVFPFSTSSSVSSDRLAFAINLARRDIKKARLMPPSNPQVSETEEAQQRHSVPSKDHPAHGKVARKGRTKRVQGVQQKETVSLRERVQRTLRKQCQDKERMHELQFYSAPDCKIEIDTDGESHQEREIRKLRKELHSYMKQMEELQQKGHPVLRNKDKRIKRRKGDNPRLSDDELDLRQVVRSEEQAARSSRMLYMLQRQVRDLEDELNKKGKNIRHTKKSQTLSRLAAAHRAAVRALQTFISYAPLQPRAGNGLPPMYQDLALLIRQLSLLTAQLQVGTDDLPDDLFVGQPHEQQNARRTSQYQPKPSAFVKEVEGECHPESRRGVALKEPHIAVRERLMPTSGNDPNSPNPSPERDAVLRAGLQALMRARENASLTPFAVSKPKAPLLSRPPPAMPVKTSVLLPAQLKAKRQRVQLAVQRVKPVDVNQARFAQDTVSSKLRKAQGQTQPVELTIKSSPRTPTKSPSNRSPCGTPPKRHGTPERLCEQLQVSPRSQHTKLEQESPRSPKYPRRMPPEERDMVEREMARQAWLDREAQRRLEELEDLRRRENHRETHTSEGVQLARRMIAETEEAIVHRLKPLLDRAGAIVDENAKHEKLKTQSLRNQLTNLASRTTMAHADELADGILDDLVEDTVLELQRLEVDDVADDLASGMQNSSTLENIRQRLQSFERVEDEIRRHWQQVKYADADVSSDITITGKDDKKKRSAAPEEPVPIMFTKTRSTHDNVNDTITRLKERARSRKSGQVQQLGTGHEERRDSNSTASLLGDISSPTDSSDMSHDGPRSRLPPSRTLRPLVKPTIALFVPSELRASIAAYKSKYERFLRDTSTHVHGTFNPWKLVERISEDLLDDLVQDVVTELGDVCDEYTEVLYKQEFVAVNGGSSSAS